MNLYIDPGTGSMLFTVAMGLLAALVYAFRNVWIKAKVSLSGGRKRKDAGGTVPFVFFTDSRRYWNLFEPICDEMEKRGQPVLYLTASEDDPALRKEYTYVRTEFAGKGNRAYARMNMLRADVVLSSTPALDVYQWKRSRDVKWYVHIYDLTKYRMFGIDYYDAVLLTGPFQEEAVRKLEQLRDLPAKELTVVGMPYLDEMRRRLQAEGEPLKDPGAPPTVLLAPSWGKSSIFNRFGDRIFDALLQTGCRLIVRPHPQSFDSEADLIARLAAKYPDSETLEWDRKDDNYDSLRRADLLITDFSGIVLDFAFLFGRPVIWADTEFDPKPYDASWLDEPMWIMRVLQNLGAPLTEDNIDRIGEIIRSCLESADLRESIAKARAEAWSHIGESAERIADYLIQKRAELEIQTAPSNTSEKAGIACTNEARRAG